MSVSRIGEFQAKEGSTGALQNFLISILPIIKSSKGCESVQLYQNQEDPARFTVIEVWDRVESHRASARNIPPKKLSEVRPLLATSPSGGYFRLIHQE